MIEGKCGKDRQGPGIASERSGCRGSLKCHYEGRVALRDACYEAFLVVGHLDHTFALSSAHSRNEVGSPSGTAGERGEITAKCVVTRRFHDQRNFSRNCCQFLSVTFRRPWRNAVRNFPSILARSHPT